MSQPNATSNRWPDLGHPNAHVPASDRPSRKRARSPDHAQRCFKLARGNGSVSEGCNNQYEENTVTYSHPTIGEIKGTKAKEGVRQFLGIQYATLKDRFAAPELRQYDQNEVVFGTKLGSQVVPIPNGPEMEQALIQHTLPYDPTTLSTSDTECLNLNITVPLGADNGLGKYRKLPVFVFIHGGGFVSGSAMWPHYDLARFVNLSRTKCKPCIGVALNYRLAAPGLLTSTELRGAGYKANNSILDQRTALLWIQKHISGFGGDPENVTVAGPVSCSYHLQSREPLFRRAMIVSVTSLQLRPVDSVAAEKSYHNTMESLGLESATVDDRVEKLLKMDAQELRTTLRAIHLAPTSDESLPLQPHTFADMSNGRVDLGARQWCESLIIGDCQFDGSIFGVRLASRRVGIAKAFCSSIRSSFASSPVIGEKLLGCYGMSSELPDDVAFEKVLEIGSDLAFYAPTVAYAEGLHGDMKIFVYRFNEPNPWEGQWKGRATHGLDVALFLQNFADHLEPKQRKLGEEMAGDVFKFMQGEAPWDEWRCQRPMAKAFGPGGRSTVTEDEAEKVGRRNTVWKVAEIADVDTVLGAYMTFMRNGAPSAPEKTSLTAHRGSSILSANRGLCGTQYSMTQQSFNSGLEDFINDIRKLLTEKLHRHVLDVEREIELEKKRYEQALSDLEQKKTLDWEESTKMLRQVALAQIST